MSPCLIKTLTSEGLQNVNYSADSLAEAVQYEPDDGVYTVTNTYDTFKTLKLDAHLDRLEDSARRAEIVLELDRARLRGALREMIAEADFGDVRFRVTVPRTTPDHLILSIEPFAGVPPELIEHGARVVTAADSARQDAATKSTDWMHNRKRLSDAMPDGVYDTILLDANGDMLEGLGSNFYAILDGELRTAGEGVLRGISQQIVLEIAPSILPVTMTPVNVSAVTQISEAFITSSSRGIVPVIEIDRHTIGGGIPGEFTRRLRRAYDVWVRDHLQAL